MTDRTHEWIAKREQLEGAATPGPWHWEPPSGAAWPVYDESLATEDGEAVLQGWGYDASGIDGDPADREFIADARTSLPAALAALKAVLEQEGPRAIGQYDDWSKGYHDALDACRDTIEAALRGES